MCIYLDNNATTRCDPAVLERAETIVARRLWECFEHS